MPDLGANAGWGTGEWLAVEADESDRSFLALAPEIAVVTNVELDHHAVFASLAELEQALRASSSPAPSRAIVTPAVAALAARPLGAARVTSRRTRRLDGARRPRRATTRRNAALALEAVLRAGADRETARRRRCATSRGVGRRFEQVGRSAAGALIVDDYAHHPTEVAATIAAARTPRRRGACSPSSSRTCTRAPRRSPTSSAPRSPAADAAWVLDVYPARERAAGLPGGQRAAGRRRGGRRALRAPTFDDAARRRSATSCATATCAS